MRIVGTLKKEGGGYIVKNIATGEDIEVKGESFPDRIVGCNVEVIGPSLDEANDFFDSGRKKVQCQKWRVV